MEENRPAPSTAETAESTHSTQPAAGLFDQLLTEVVALRTFTAHYIAASMDAGALRVRNFILRLFLLGLAVLLLLFLSGTLLIYLVRGVDGGLCAAFEREWVGHLLTGVLGLTLLASSTALVVIGAQKRHRELSIARYEQRKACERGEVGRDIDDSEEKT
jgi:hypothetical protein